MDLHLYGYEACSDHWLVSPPVPLHVIDGLRVGVIAAVTQVLTGCYPSVVTVTAVILVQIVRFQISPVNIKRATLNTTESG